jgi:pimeloyl-ACP methyl ester carboxylesterase
MFTAPWDTETPQGGAVPHVKRDGVKLHYERRGSGDLALLFVPGWCCAGTAFAPQLEHFAASCTVTAADPRGCGGSDAPEGGYDIPSLADDLAALCRELRIEKPVVIGHSLGGMVAVELAARYPDLVSAVVGVDPGPIHATPEATAIYRGLTEQLAGPDGETVRRNFAHAAVQSPTIDEDVRDTMIEAMCAVPLRAATALMCGVPAWNGVAALALCEVPMLMLLAYPAKSNDAWRLLPLKPDLHYAMTVGSGHFNQLEVPEQVNAIIERFLETAVRKSPLFATA